MKDVCTFFFTNTSLAVAPLCRITDSLLVLLFRYRDIILIHAITDAEFDAFFFRESWRASRFRLEPNGHVFGSRQHSYHVYEGICGQRRDSKRLATGFAFRNFVGLSDHLARSPSPRRTLCRNFQRKTEVVRPNHIFSMKRNGAKSETVLFLAIATS